MKEYLFIVIAAVLFSVQFLFTKRFQLVAGNNTESAFYRKMVAPIGLIIILFIYNGFRFHVTPFSLFLAFINAIVVNVLAFYTLKALALGSVANFSLYLLGGGMIIPIIYGFFFNGDEVNAWKLISIFLITVAIFIKMDRKEKVDVKKIICFMGLFLFNGLTSVVSAVHSGNLFSFEKASSIEYVMLYNLLSMFVGGIVFFIFRHKNKEKAIELKTLLKVTPWGVLEGVCNGIANLLLLWALLVVEPSLQYPIATGGSIFLSAIFGLLCFKEKLDKKSWLSVILAVIGTVVIIL